MTKIEFFNDLNDIVTDKIFIANSIEGLLEEARQNMWSISASEELCHEILVEDFVDFFQKVIENRKKQIFDLGCNHSMIFYIWFDELACQLRFSLISDWHKQLPFSCEINPIESLETIITEFLKSKYHDGMPISVSSEDGTNEKEQNTVHILDVFIKHL